jgi:hypothetical protein
LTQSKICHWRHGLHETFTNVQFPPTTLIRLYEFLKNSRLAREIPGQQQSSLTLLQAQSRFGVDSNKYRRSGGG